jgi:2-methylfumaryl-CoA hydratase
MTVEEAEHQIATRLYQNTAKVHFDAFAQKESRFGRRLIYGGVAISLARALAFNGLANAAYILAINAGRHVAPLYASDTIYAWSEVLDKAELSSTVGALRLRLVASKNLPSAAFPDRTPAGEYDPAVVLDFDYWAAIPR